MEETRHSQSPQDSTVYRVRVDTLAPLSGTIEVEGADGQAVQFSGWIELMAKINGAGETKNHHFR